MLQDIGLHSFHNEFEPRKPLPDDIALYYEGRNALLLGEADRLCLPTMSQLQAGCPRVMDDARYLFSIDGQGFFLVRDVDASALPGRMEPIELFRTFEPQHMGFAGVTGSHLHRFYQQNTFCGCCAQPMEPSATERAMQCKDCGNIVYPRISPAVIVGVTDGDRLLMTKYAGRAFARYALVAGFAEFGETLESTVRREVMEEVGLRVKNLRYFQSQPWPFSDSLLLGYFCELDGDDHVALDTNELSEGTWFHRSEIPPAENLMSLTATMIEAFRLGQHEIAWTSAVSKIGGDAL